MSLVPRSRPLTYNDYANTAIDIAPNQPDNRPVDLLATTAAAFRQENMVGSVLSRHWAGGPAVADYNPWDDIKGTEYEEHWDSFTRARNPAQTAALKRQIDMEREDRRTIAAAGGWGLLASIGAGVFSPENFLPGGAIYRGARFGSSVGRSFMSGAAASAAASGISEIALQATQETRSLEQSAFDIGGSAIIGGTLGGVIAGVLSRADVARLGKAMARENEAAFNAPDVDEAEVLRMAAADAGAAARSVDTLDDLTIASASAQGVSAGPLSRLNPVLRVLHSPSALVRDVGTRLFENPAYLKKNLEGRASAPGVETLVKQYTQGAVARAIDGTNRIYREYRKTGRLNRSEFNEAVGRAMRRGDAGSDPAITAAAEQWRSLVFDPLKERAISARLLPADVSVDTAMSYFSRVYNKPLIEAREVEFKGIVRRYIYQQVRNAEIRSELSQIEGTRVAPPKNDPPAFVSEADRASYVDEITNNIYDTITGRNVDGDIPRDIVAATRGPLKDRTFSIADSEIEEFLESNVEAVGRRYARSMAADIEMTEVFGRADLKDQIDAIRAQYNELRKGASEAERRKLNALEKSDIRDIRALRDMIRGAYKREENSSNFARVARVAGIANYVRVLGGVTLGSSADVARPLMVHHLSGVMRDGLLPLIRNFKGFQMSVEEAKIAGAVTEGILNTRMATWADITDPYSISSPFEKFVENFATGFSRLTGITLWTDSLKAFSSVITQNRVLRNSTDYANLNTRERSYLAYLGIDGSMAERIAQQFERHGSVEAGGIRVAHTDDWDDEIARRTYRAAILKDTDTTVVTKGVGDVPLFMNTPTGRLAMQFKGFALASHQRVLMRGLQEGGDGRFLLGMMFAATMGMMVYALKSLESNRTEDISDNPGRWIAEGLDRSGIFSIAFEVNNTIEKHFNLGAYGAFQAAFPDADQSGKSSRYMTRSASSTIVGPTGDLIDAMIMAGNAIKGDGKPWTEADINSIKRLVPGATLPGIRSLVEYLGVPAAKQALGAQ